VPRQLSSPFTFFSIHQSQLFPTDISTLIPWSRVLLEMLTGSHSMNSPSFKKPKGSLPHSQQLATCPYPDPDQSSPCHPIPLPEDTFQYYTPIYAWVSQVVAFSQGSPPKPCMHPSCLLYVLHAAPISFFLIWSPEKYLVRSTYH